MYSKRKKNKIKIKKTMGAGKTKRISAKTKTIKITYCNP